MKTDYDMLVIGGGSAGLVAAGMSALLGAKTLLVEQDRLGGDCTWYGCVPSKTLLHAARVAHAIQTADRFGLTSCAPEHDFGRVMEHVRAIREQVYQAADAPPNIERLGAAVLQAKARFVDPHTVELAERNGGARKVTSRYFVIATGSRPVDPHFHAPVLTNETIFELTARPAHLVILGSGPVGIEMAQALRRLGSSVTVVTPERAILPRDEPELAALLLQTLQAEGVQFVFGQRATAADQEPGGMQVQLEDGRKLACDAVLAAIGRQANIGELGLEKAGVETSRKGIQVDDRCRTSQRHIYASGDVTGRYQFTHMSEHMSKTAVTNAILHLPKRLDENHVTWCTFSDPELARLGASRQQLQERGEKFSVHSLPFAKIDRATAEGETTGAIQVLATGSGRILGVSILGARAGDMIAEFALAMRNGVRLGEISETIHAYPTYALGNRQAADQWNTRRLDSPLLSVLAKLFGYRGVRRGASAL